jgi:hypothetical protein
MSCLGAALLAGMPAAAALAALSVPHHLIGLTGTVLVAWLVASIPIGVLVGHLTLDD